MDKIPLDILVKIVDAAEPLDHCHIRLVCKSLKEAVECAAVHLSPRRLTGAQLIHLGSKFSRAVSLVLAEDHSSIDSVEADLTETLHNLPFLKKLVIKYTYLLRGAPPEAICGLSRLEHLSLEDCWHLKSLPEGLGGLTALQILNLCSCCSLTSLPDTLGQLTGLQTLNLEYCDLLTYLPETMGQLTGLHTLNLGSCDMLKALPESLSCLSSLQVANIDR